MSVNFVSAILGPEMAAQILWAPRISAFFLQENLHTHKIPRFWGGVFLVWGGGGEVKCRFYFYGRADFSDNNSFSNGEMPRSLGMLLLVCVLIDVHAPIDSRECSPQPFLTWQARMGEP